MATVTSGDDFNPYRKRVMDSFGDDDGGLSPGGPGNLPKPMNDPLPGGGGMSPGGPGNLPPSGGGGLPPVGPGRDRLSDGGPGMVSSGLMAGEPNPNGGLGGLPRPTPTDDPSGGRGFVPPSPQQGGYDLEALRKAWTAQGIGAKTSPEALKAFLASRPDIAQGVTTSASGDALFDPQGRFIADAIADVGGRNTVGFLDGIDSKGKPRTPAKGKGKGKLDPVPKGGISIGGPGNLPPGGGAGGAGGGVAGGGGGTAPPAANDFLTQVRQMIMDRMGAMSKDPSLDDPALAAQSAAYRRSRERGADQERAAMAERAAAQGTLQGGQSSGVFDTDLQGIREGASEDIAGNDAQLLGNEMMQRRAELQNLHQMALASGDAEAARQLQQGLANLDAQLRRESMRMQDKHFNADLGYRNRALAQSGSQFDRSFGLQQDQFGRSLGRDYEDDYRWRAMFGLGG